MRFPDPSPARAARLALLLMLWLAPLAAAAAQAPGATDAESRRGALDAIRQQITELERRLGGLERQAGGLEGRLERVELELELQSRMVAEAEAARALALARVEASTTQVEALEAELAAARRDLRSRLRALYRLGGFGYVRLLLAVGPEADPLEAVRGLRYLARRDATAVDRFVELGSRLAHERGERIEQLREAESWAAQERARRAELAAVERRQRRLLAEVRREGDRLAAEAERLRAKERKLATLLDRLAAGEALGGTPMQSYKGVLDWPASGEVRVGFGTVRDPRYRTRLPHHGIEIALARRQAVRNVYPGRVLFAGPFEGYGAMVVVLHPGRVFSVYGGLESLRAESGDMLSLGDAVGLASSSFYFEIRVENRPEDPLQWLR